MIEIKVTLEAGDSMERLADRLARLVCPPEKTPARRTRAAKDAPAPAEAAQQPVPQQPAAAPPAGAVQQPQKTEDPAQTPAQQTAAHGPQPTADTGQPAAAPQPQEPTLADIREVLGPKMQELTERYGREEATRRVSAVFAAVGAPETNTAAIPQGRRAEFIRQIGGLQ